MTKYQVKSDHKGVVMFGETPFRAGQIVDDKNQQIKDAIAKYLKMSNSPIVAVNESDSPAPAKPKDKPGAK